MFTTHVGHYIEYEEIPSVTSTPFISKNQAKCAAINLLELCWIHLKKNALTIADTTYKLFYESLSFVDNKFRFIKGVVFGWFKYDVYLKRLCIKEGLPLLHNGISFHDYDLPIGKLKLSESWGRDKLRRIKLFLS